MTIAAPLLGGAIIGAAAASLLLFNGRIAGVTGIAAGIFTRDRSESLWRIAFLAGLVVGGLVMFRLSPASFGGPLMQSAPLAVGAGLLVGFGTRLANGCTSGHGVCGIARLSPRSLLATATFMGAGMLTVFAVRHLLRFGVKTVLFAFAAGLLFASGLAVSGMANPANVIGFLDIAGDWNPSLALVMAGALGVYAPLQRLIRKRPAPLFSGVFSPLPKTRVDAQLIGGSVLFGVGWGLSGYCPGPALTNLAMGAPMLLLFVAAMVAGFLIHQFAFPAAGNKA